MTMHYIIFLDLGSAEHKVKFLSIGDSTVLPCIVNASNNIYPVPESIEWLKDDSQLEYEVRYGIVCKDR